MDVGPESCHADLFVTGPNKCLGCPPGLSLLGVSPHAWEKMKANPAAPRDSILSILDWEAGAWRRDRPFPFTPSVAEINGLDAALDLYLAEGPEQVWARHALTAAACRAGVLAMGLSLWPADDRTASPTTTAVRIPAARGCGDPRAARARYGVVFSSGRGETLGKLVRIGHMGPTATAAVRRGRGERAGRQRMRALRRTRLDVGAGMAASARRHRRGRLRRRTPWGIP